MKNHIQEHIQEAENLPEASRSRRAFLQLSALGAIGTLPLWNAATSQAAQAKDTAFQRDKVPLVAASPMPIVDARFPCRIADGIWIVPDKRIDLVPNIGIVEGSKSVLVIDCGFTPGSGQSVLNAARAIAGKREIILTTTHSHPEHTFGAQAFKGHARIYTNKLQRDYLAHHGLAFKQGFPHFLPPEQAHLLDDVRITPADEVYEGNHASLDLGDRVVEFSTYGIAHSPGDQIIHIPDQNVTFSGDLIEERMFPIVPLFPPMIGARDINVRTWQTILTMMAEQKPRIIVPGHGNLGGIEIAHQVNNYLGNTRHLVESSGAGQASAIVSRLQPIVRKQHPTWERTQFIAPALGYFAQERTS